MKTSLRDKQIWAARKLLWLAEGSGSLALIEVAHARLTRLEIAQWLEQKFGGESE